MLGGWGVRVDLGEVGEGIKVYDMIVLKNKSF